MRLFAAIELTDEMKDELCAAQDGLRRAGVRGNFSKRENLHLTLAFIGEYPDPSRVLGALDEVRFEPFKISLGRAGSFRSVFWIGIEDEREASRLAAKVRESLAARGIPYDKKPFSPHITILRQPSVSDLPETSAPRASMTASKITLFRSDRGVRGVVYTALN
ncbi:MAG: RNA 2',3'-cyclic phosphodiesterase [Clostridia bacterium]|nr:RNA 2',3'-cyclic phosphodiesterase [Clostridia bacterium]